MFDLPFEKVKVLLREMSDQDLDEVRKKKLSDVEDRLVFSVVRVRNFAGYEYGRRCGWWADWNENEPIPNTKTFKIGQFGPSGSIAHVLVELGVFKSVTQARKNGFDKPLVLGEIELTKKKIRVEIVE